MKKILILALLSPQLALAQVPSNGPIIGVPDNTQCLSTGNNGFCNQYRPGGPASVTGLETIPAYTNTGSPPTAVLAPVDALATYNRKILTSYNQLKFDFLGDSRTDNLYVSSSNGVQFGVSGLNWFNQANALANNRYILGINGGKSGCRTDQYLQDINFNQLLTSDAKWVVFNFPAVNNLAAIGSNCSISPGGGGGSFPFTNSNGVTITQTNVGQIAAQDIITRAKQLLNIGKSVILIEEPGAANLSAASVGQQYDLNARLRAFCTASSGCYMLSLNGSVWNATGSTTLDTYQAGVLLDNVTHYSILGGYQQALYFNSWFQSLFPANANLAGLFSINDNNANNSRQLVNNALFQTQTGGTNTNCSLTGNLPSGWTLICGVGTTAVTVSYVSDPSGLGGSCVQLAITSAGVDTVRLQSNAPSTSLWNLTDWFQSSVVVSVANGSSNAKVYSNTALSTNLGTKNAIALYGGDPATGGGSNAGPTTAYTYTLVTPAAQVLTGSTSKSFVLGPVVTHMFTAAGAMTTTICRPSFNRIYNYDASAGLTGQ